MYNPFLKPPSDYKRDLDVVGNYKRDCALYVSKRSGLPIEKCRAYVDKVLGAGGKFELKVPEVMCLHRNKVGDREQTTMPFTQYLNDITANEWLFSPAMTVYENPKVEESILSVYTGGNVIGRNKVKGEGFEAQMLEQEAKQKGDKAKQKQYNELAELKENQQATYKTSNNSLSGAQASASTILYNKSAHSSLTSSCRSATSYGNANNEKFLAGNRHYWCPDIVKANIISIIGHVDYELIRKAVEVYGLVLPTTDQAMAVVTRSTGHYWRNDKEIKNIRALLDSLDGYERAAFVYVGDMYHLAQFNHSFFHTFLTRMSAKGVGKFTFEEADVLVKSMDPDLKAFVSLLCTKELDGLAIKALAKLAKEDAEALDRYSVLAATVKNVVDCIGGYGLLIEAFWVTDNVPASIAHVRNSVRHVAITSDTDSTIFTVQQWVEWYQGFVDLSDVAFSINYTIVYLATQNIIHVLAKLSTILGVAPDKINVLAMKNEYAFSVFSLTSMAKHYYAYMAAREGNVYKELKEEIKGVYLKDSNCPPEIMKQVTATIKEIMDTVIKGEKISIKKLYRKIAVIEEDIISSVLRGESKYLSRASVKSKESYTNPQSSPYRQFEIWRDVFAKKYGDSPEPPYAAIKVSLDTPNRTAIQAWLDRIGDEHIRTNLMEVLSSKSNMTTLLLPKDNVERMGLPVEVTTAMNIRKLVFNTVRPFYLILESLGIFLVNENNTRLVSDFVRGWDNQDGI